MSDKEYENNTDCVEAALDQADKQAGSTSQRLSHEQVFHDMRKVLRDCSLSSSAKA